jgi:hypothetical protein
MNDDGGLELAGCEVVGEVVEEDGVGDAEVAADVS